MSENYQMRAIAPEVLKQLRITDDAGNPPRVVVDDEEGGSPMRCCLGRSRPYETIALVSYAPLRRWARRRRGPGPARTTRSARSSSTPRSATAGAAPGSRN
ncbi:hypothetical protein SANTM175S_10443 [Streptomyces antimycoticus]